MGWTLNVSKGGARLVVEQPVEPEAIASLRLGEEAAERKVRVVWVQDESDGQIVGVEFIDDSKRPSSPGTSGETNQDP